MKEEPSNPVQHVTVSDRDDGRRLDNFIMSQLRGVPKSLVYKLLRTGQVRVNKSRKKADYRVKLKDIVRIPPVSHTIAHAPEIDTKKITFIESCVLYEDPWLIVLNKPCNMAVHGGSGLQYGVIEAMRELRSDAKQLDLVHRLDRATSGCLLIAKHPRVLKSLHAQLREKTMQKNYYAIVSGLWPKRLRRINVSLKKNHLSSGERIVKACSTGQNALTLFKPISYHGDFSIIEAQPISGRTHQIRVHCAHGGHPIVGDEKYAERSQLNHQHNQGLKRLYLHAYSLSFMHPETQKQLSIVAPILDEWLTQLKLLEKKL